MYFHVRLKERNNGLDFPNSYSSRQGHARKNRQYKLPSRVARYSGRDRREQTFVRMKQVKEDIESYKSPGKHRIRSTLV